MFFAGIFSTEVDEEDKDEDIVQVKATLYRKLQTRIKSMGLELFGGAEPIKLRHYLVMWILLAIGFMAGVASFIWETFIKNGFNSVTFLNHSKARVSPVSMQMFD